MQINYMRFAIYGLTFLTYAYSGYGSNIIYNLRDAIIAAEAVFGDVFKNVIHVARKFQTVHSVFDAAVEENCIFKCPGGENFNFLWNTSSILFFLWNIFTSIHFFPLNIFTSSQTFHFQRKNIDSFSREWTYS